MPRSTETRKLRRKAGLLARVKGQNEDALRCCAVFGCGRPTAARAGRGLSAFHCRAHVQAKNRNGHLWKKTYTAAELRSYRRAAERYLKARSDDFWIASALHAFRALLDGAGPVERIVDVARQKPTDKARAALARMRHADVPPLRLLTIALAVEMAVKEDPIEPSDGGEFARCQKAKAAMRTASGAPATDATGGVTVRYPRSRGLVLRHLGRMLEDASEHVVAAHLDAALAFKVAEYGARDRTVHVGRA